MLRLYSEVLNGVVWSLSGQVDETVFHMRTYITSQLSIARPPACQGEFLILVTVHGTVVKATYHDKHLTTTAEL